MDCECSICLEKLVESPLCENTGNNNESRAQTQLTSNKCGHVFHEKCINDWMNKNTHCPICRDDLHRYHLRRIYLDVPNNRKDWKKEYYELKQKYELLEVEKLSLMDHDTKNKDLTKELEEAKDGAHMYMAMYESLLESHGREIARLKGELENIKSEGVKRRKIAVLDRILNPTPPTPTSTPTQSDGDGMNSNSNNSGNNNQSENGHHSGSDDADADSDVVHECKTI